MKFPFIPRRRSTPLLLATVALTGMAGFAVITPSWADTAPVYVALGDSYASGVGAPPESGPCRQSPQSAAQLWASGHGANFTFAACSGATTADVINKQLGGLSPETTLVTVTVGGNDVDALETAFACVLQGDANCSIAINQAEAEIATGLYGRLDGFYTAIKNRAPNARLVVLGYPRPFELTPVCPLGVLDLYQRGLADHAADLLDQVIQDRAAAAGATFVDVRSAFAGHGICSDSAWIRGVDSPLSEVGHPNAEGYRSGYLAPLVAVTG